MIVLDPVAVRELQQKIMDWWSINARDLPWRNDSTPYEVLVSEVMLQQTQANRVIPKYEEFLKEYPTLERLAVAETKQLLKVWSGLGYNRRALWLRDAAREIVRLGAFPREVKTLRALKGIGEYTSRSILIFAFNDDIAAVDTNIRRVLIASHLADETMSKTEVQRIAEVLLLRGRSRDWHNALMDYGAMVLTAGVTGIAPLSRQPCFKGSSREIRGAIVRALTRTESMTANQLYSQMGLECDKSMMNSILQQLVSEGLVEIHVNGEFRIS